MQAFTGSLIKKYPDKQFNFLVAFKKGKDYQDMLPMIIPWAKMIVLTSFYTEDQDMINASEEVKVISKYLEKIKFNKFKINLSLKKAWKDILVEKGSVVVVGSLYLVGEIFKLIKKK